MGFHWVEHFHYSTHKLPARLRLLFLTGAQFRPDVDPSANLFYLSVYLCFKTYWMTGCRGESLKFQSSRKHVQNTDGKVKRYCTGWTDLSFDRGGDTGRRSPQKSLTKQSNQDFACGNSQRDLSWHSHRWVNTQRDSLRCSKRVCVLLGSLSQRDGSCQSLPPKMPCVKRKSSD